ncbi:MAG: permease [Desulfovibrionaceae bacterium]|nr:permease [Desulfovibrionaceae bacterium]
MEQGSALGAGLQFFLYDTAKILLLLLLLLYLIAWLRAALNVERVRDMLAGKRRGLGYALAALFGSVTPFCSCSSIPLFLGFSSAGIPIGITMAFLITSPLINEVAVVLLWNLLDWKFTVIYAAVGMGAGIIGGFAMDALRAGRWLQPLVLEAIAHAAPRAGDGAPRKLSVRQRHLFAWNETVSLFRRVWRWVLIGVAVGAVLHGVVPENWFAQNFGAGEWWTVPAAVLLGIPLYTSVTGIVPIMESLLVKGLPIGTTMAFCMSSVAASIPGLIMLRQIMSARLLALFIGYLWVVFTLAGWVFNAAQAYLF